jgi:hypothetical protein
MQGISFRRLWGNGIFRIFQHLILDPKTGLPELFLKSIIKASKGVILFPKFSQNKIARLLQVHTQLTYGKKIYTKIFQRL